MLLEHRVAHGAEVWALVARIDNVAKLQERGVDAGVLIGATAGSVGGCEYRDGKQLRRLRSGWSQMVRELKLPLASGDLSRVHLKALDLDTNLVPVASD